MTMQSSIGSLTTMRTFWRRASVFTQADARKATPVPEREAKHNR